MKKISDDDLTLLYYGEPEDPELAAKVAASPDLMERFEALSKALDHVDDHTPPDRGDDYGAEIWQRISPELETGKRSVTDRLNNFFAELGRPRFSLAGALSLVLVAALAFLLGRNGGPVIEPAPPGAVQQDIAVAAALDSGRLLTSSVSGHLEQLNLALTQFANAPQTTAADAERATDLLIANRLYRQAASARGNQSLAAFLTELEPLLIELAYEAHKTSDTTRDRMQKEIRDSLLFRVRIMNKQLDDSRIST